MMARILKYILNPRSSMWIQTGQQHKNRDRKRFPQGVINLPLTAGGIIVLLLIVIVWFGPKFAAYDPYITSRLAPTYFDAEQMTLVEPPFPPGPQYPLGSDRYGNDILSLLLYGARTTLVTCTYITAGKILLGLILGSMAGWRGGSRADRLIMNLAGVLSSIPLLLSALLMILALGIKNGVWVFVLSLTVLGWTEIAQTVRGETIRIRKMLYIEAAKALGMTPLEIFIRHVLPNLFSQLIILSFLEMGSTLLILAELGFLKVFIGGSDIFIDDPMAGRLELIPRVPEWGNLIAQGTPYFRSYPHIIFGVALAFLIAILGLNAFGEGLRRIFERWPISTTFLLRKEALLITVLLVGISQIIFKHTNPQVSYQTVAETYSQDRVVARYEELQAASSRGPGTGGEALEGYIIEKFKEYDVETGWAQIVISHHQFPVTVSLRKPLQEPILRIGPDRFTFGVEFGFRTEGCAGSGGAQTPLVFLGGSSWPEGSEFEDTLNEKIVLLQEHQVSPAFWSTAAARGIQGALVVIPEDTPLSSQYEVTAGPEAEECPGGTIPVFDITQAAARRIAAQAKLDWDLLQRSSRDMAEPIILSTSGTLDLELGEAQRVDVPNAIGFLGGFDYTAASEIVVVYTTFDGLGLSPQSAGYVPDEDLAKIALLLEIIRTWQENNLDPRRSIQFVIWGGEGLQGPHFELLSGILLTNKLAARVPTRKSVKPAIWIEIGELGAGPGELLVSSRSTDYLQEIMQDAADQTEIALQFKDPAFNGVNSGLPNLTIWQDRDPSGEGGMDLEGYLSRGILLNRTLIQLARDVATTVKGERLIRR